MAEAASRVSRQTLQPHPVEPSRQASGGIKPLPDDEHELEREPVDVGDCGVTDDRADGGIGISEAASYLEADGVRF
jgi:hypothetical protein